MEKPLFLILHGSFSSPEANWFPQLRVRLERLEQEVIVPELPCDDWDAISADNKPSRQTLTHWLETMKTVVPLLKDRQLVVVAHSLGPLFALHLCKAYGLSIDCLIAVSPFLELSDSVTPNEIQKVNHSFYQTQFDFDTLRKQIKTTYVLYSENDPYVPRSASLAFSTAMSAAPIMVRGAAHMNAEANMNEFPLVLELCKSRIDLTLYQRYIDHRAELFSEDTARYHSEGTVTVSAKDMFDEGIFKFRNLRKHGFCTLPTGSKYWDNESTYMREA